MILIRIEIDADGRIEPDASVGQLPAGSYAIFEWDKFSELVVLISSGDFTVDIN